MDDITYALNQYPWLKDFCSYVNKNNLTWIETYLQHAEIHWMTDLSSWNYRKEYTEALEHMGLYNWKINEGIPNSLLYYLVQVFDHLSGSSQDFTNRFKAWLNENYQVNSLQLKHPKGKRILNEYRLAFLEYKGDWKNIIRTEEQDYIFTIANGVDVEHGFDSPIAEEVMCEAIEYAEEHNLRIEPVPDEIDVLNNVQIGIHYHPKFKEKS